MPAMAVVPYVKAATPTASTQIPPRLGINDAKAMPNGATPGASRKATAIRLIGMMSDAFPGGASGGGAGLCGLTFELSCPRRRAA